MASTAPGQAKRDRAAAGRRFARPARIDEFLPAAVRLSMVLLALLLVLVLFRWALLPAALVLVMYHLALRSGSRLPRLLAAGTLLFATAVLAIALFTPALRPVQSWLASGSPPRPADAIVVLGGGLHCLSGELEGASLARLVRAAELHNAGLARVIVLSDTPRGARGWCPSVGRVQHRVLEQLKLDHAKVEFLAQVGSTRQEAERLAALASQRGWRSALLVTSPAHSRRAALTFRKVGVPVVPVPSSEPAYDTSLGTPADRFQALGFMLREVTGLLWYRLRGWI